MADPRLASILDRSGDPATVAWAHDGEGNLPTLADPELAIAAAGELGNAAVLQAVTEPKALRKAAAAALHRLKSRGVKVEEKLPAKSFTLPREALGVPPRAFLGAPNAAGNCHLLLTATDFEGSCIMELIVGGSDVRDHHGHASRSELRAFWRDMEADPTMSEVPFIVGLHLADRVVRGRSIHGWEHFLSKVPAGALPSARLADPMRHALPDTGESALNWVLPASLVPASVVDQTVKSMPEAEGGADEGWLDAGAAAALEGSGRGDFAAAADFAALVFGLIGQVASAADARTLASRLRAGEAASAFPELRSAVILATYQEIQHRQAEQRQDIEAMMRKIGQQRGE